MRPNFNASLDQKPALHQVQRAEHGDVDWRAYAGSNQVRRWYGCNSYVDREIGRVVDAVDELHGKDTLVLYTSDHGDQARSHGLLSKGPMMYEESVNIPLIARIPGGPSGAISRALVSHIDIMPTLLDVAGIERPEVLNGTPFTNVLSDPSAAGRERCLLSFHRFAINHDSYGEFYPIRAAVDSRYKLILNLFDTDDPCRSWMWGARPWRSVRRRFYHGGVSRNRPAGFSFQATSIDAS
jgi:uncharacterized sulfatase